MTWLFVWIWGFFWAISRFYLTKLWAIIFWHHFPFGTLLVNWLWSFIIGLLFGIFEVWSLQPHYKSMITTGFLGALTTYSTFALESFMMIDSGNYKHFMWNISLNLVWTILLAGLGFYLGSFLAKNYFNFL